MNEASETKRLLVLEAGSWRQLEELPLTLGPRHVRSSGAAAAEQLIQLAAAAEAGHEGEEAEAGADGDGAAAVAAVGGLRAGDRVKWRLSAAEAKDEAVVRAVEQLERAGGWLWC